jgi:hypothetical protein
VRRGSWMFSLSVAVQPVAAAAVAAVVLVGI